MVDVRQLCAVFLLFEYYHVLNQILLLCGLVLSIKKESLLKLIGGCIIQYYPRSVQITAEDF